MKPTLIPCPHCAGTGQVYDVKASVPFGDLAPLVKCQPCKGTGSIEGV